MPVFAFLDESGDYRFCAEASKFIVFAAVIVSNPLLLTSEFSGLQYDLLCEGHCIERFHASEDKQFVRDRVFQLLQREQSYRIHAIIVRKNRANPSLYKYGVYTVAYKAMLSYLTKTVKPDRLHIVVDTIPDKKQQKVLATTLRNRAAEIIEPLGIGYTIDHHNSTGHALLQASDYCAWAIYKKWHEADERSYQLIRDKIGNEFDIYRGGDIEYY
jgi:Protein of unknown function (DUF3800)